jgi:putative Mg2+ transporter-C (MgtC) family protein
MPFFIDWTDIASRLALTIIACGILGWERGETDRAAGTRTTLVVGLAACVAMIQTNLLLVMPGKTPDSFAVADVMRLPLGILTGVGFIGAGAILRRSDRVVGLTTAATLWFVTVVGLCFGGGQLTLGLAASIIALIILHVLKVLDKHRSLERHLRLHITWQLSIMSEDDLRQRLQEAHFGISEWHFHRDIAQQTANLRCNLRWHTKAENYEIPPALRLLEEQPGVTSMGWSL